MHQALTNLYTCAQSCLCVHALLELLKYKCSYTGMHVLVLVCMQCSMCLCVSDVSIAPLSAITLTHSEQEQPAEAVLHLIHALPALSARTLPHKTTCVSSMHRILVAHKQTAGTMQVSQTVSNHNGECQCAKDLSNAHNSCKLTCETTWVCLLVEFQYWCGCLMMLMQSHLAIVMKPNLQNACPCLLMLIGCGATGAVGQQHIVQTCHAPGIPTQRCKRTTGSISCC